MSEFTVISLMIRVLFSTLRVTFLRSFNKACVHRLIHVILGGVVPRNSKIKLPTENLVVI